MPLQTAVNPKTNETAVLVGSEWKTASQVAVNPSNQSKAYLVDGAWVTDDGKPGTLPVPKTGLQKAAGAVKDAVVTGAKGEVGLAETAGTLATGAVATPLAGLAGIAQGTKNVVGEATGLWKPGMPAADRVRQVQEGMTYQPRTEMGQQMTGAVGEGLSYVTAKPGNWVGEHGADLATHWGASPELAAAIGAGGNALTQVVPQMLLAKGVGMARAGMRAPPAAEVPPASTWGKGGASGAPEGAGGAAGAGADAAARAKAYVGTLGLDWGALSAQFQAKLTGIAQDATALGRLKPEQVARQARMASVGIDNPSKGQVTRSPTQKGLEADLKNTDAGKELLDRDYEHNKILVDSVENLRKKVMAESLPSGGKARGDLPVGRSVQDTALRAKEEASMGRVNNLYTKARKLNPDATAPADAFFDLLDQNPTVQHLGWVSDFLNKGKVQAKAAGADGIEVLERRELNLAELQDLRVRANKIIKGGGPDAHYAADVKEAIDAAMETAPEAAAAWKQANSAYRTHKQEFANQTAVRNLVEDKPHTSDRRVAIEETAQKTVMGKLEDLQKVKRSLLTGEDPAARAAGKTAWRDLKGWGLDYIRERMTRGPKNERGDAHATWVGMKRALDDIGDANLDEMYGPTVRKQLRRYQDVMEDLWTEPSTRQTGSPTFGRILRFLDRIGGVPVVGKGAAFAAGTAKTVAKIGELGSEGRQVRNAMEDPLSEQLAATRRDVKKSQNLANRKEFVKKAAPLAPAAENRQQ